MPIKLRRDTKIAIGWAACVVVGLYSFVLSKRTVDQQRYENMKIRERMRKANTGEYDRVERFREK